MNSELSKILLIGFALPAKFSDRVATDKNLKRFLAVEQFPPPDLLSNFLAVL